MARPPSCTPDRIEPFIALLRAGNYRKTALAAAGISTATLWRWERAAECGEEPYRTVIDRVLEAEALGESELLGSVHSAMDNWQAKAWILERKYPAKWSGRVRIIVQEEMSNLLLKLKERDPETWLKVLRVVAEDDSGLAVGTSAARVNAESEH